MRLIPLPIRPNRGLRRGGALTGNDSEASAASAAIFSGGRSELRFFSCHGGHGKVTAFFQKPRAKLCECIYIIVPEMRANAQTFSKMRWRSGVRNRRGGPPKSGAASFLQRRANYPWDNLAVDCLLPRTELP